MNILHTLSQTAKYLSSSPRYCRACLFELPVTAKPSGIDLDPPVERVFWESDTHTASFDDLAQSARRGCPTCADLVGYFDSVGIQCAAVEWYHDGGPGGGRPQVVCHVEGGDRVAMELCTTLGEFVEDSEVHPSICPGVKVVGGTGGEDAFAFAKEWLDECREKHDKCCKTDGFVPTRLLDISEEELVNVVLKERMAAPVMYAALSHRWSAETEAVIVTAANIQGRKTDGIPLARLPLLMRDAIAAIRRLGIDYVWIDSLCIIQDSREDWKVEAAMMAQVYSNAEITVAATWCHGGGQSLFSSREGEEFTVADITPIEGRPSLFVRRTVPHIQFTRGLGVPPEEMIPGLDSQQVWPLLSRGWVYQEQWLSRRMLHFTEHELVWVCLETSACECGWCRFDDTEHIPEETAVDTRGTRWADIIEDYSDRAFTQIADRLPALAGIATVYSAKNFPGQYICGLWSHEMPGALFWRPSGESRSSRPEVKMPTWSWASVTGSVEAWSDDAGNDEDIGKIDILDIQVDYHGKDLMGDVSEAILRISGLVVPARAYYGTRWREVLNAAGKVDGDKKPERAHGLEIEGKLASFVPDYALDNRGDNFVPNETPALCLLVSQRHIGNYDPDHPEENREAQFADGLVLRPVSEGGNLYQRIGMFSGWELDDGFELEMMTELSKRMELTVV